MNIEEFVNRGHRAQEAIDEIVERAAMDIIGQDCDDESKSIIRRACEKARQIGWKQGIASVVREEATIADLRQQLSELSKELYKRCELVAKLQVELQQSEAEKEPLDWDD